MVVKPNPDAPSRAGWSEPKAAYDEYKPGLSPYLHYFTVQRNRRDNVEPPPDHGSDAGADLPGQLEEALRKLIGESLG